MDLQHFWDDKHTTNNILWLTGSSLWEITHYHNLKESDFRDFLEIGVGTGSLKAELEERGLLKHYAPCDISLISRNGEYNTKDLKMIRPVPLAICHLVFQHCPNEEIERIINDVQLTKDGVFSFQIAIPIGKKKTNLVSTWENEGLLNFPPLEEVLKMIERSNKELISISEPFRHVDNYNLDWYILKVCSQ